VWSLPLAQESGPSNTQQLFDQLARTPLSHVLLFVFVCTVVRCAFAPTIAKTQPHMRTGFYTLARFFNEGLDAIIYAGVVVFMLIRPFAVQTFLIPSESMVHTLEINDFIIANKAIYRYSEPQRGDIIVFRPPPEALDAGQQDVDFIKRLMGKPGDVVEVRDGIVVRNGQKLDEPYVNEPPIKGDWKLVHYEGPYAPWKDKYIPVTYNYPDAPADTANYEVYTAKQYDVGWNQDAPNVNDFSVPRDWKMQDELSAEEKARIQYLVDAKPAPIPDGYLLMMGDNRNRSYDGRGWGLVPRDNVVGRAEVIWWPASRWGRTRPVRTGADAGH
jgi:signal peptidase I